MADLSLEPELIEAPSVSIVEFKSFANYIRKAITILLPDDDESSSKLEEALDENRGNQECIKKFLSDPQVQALYIQKSATKGESQQQQQFFNLENAFHILFWRNLSK